MLAMHILAQNDKWKALYRNILSDVRHILSSSCMLKLSEIQGKSKKYCISSQKTSMWVKKNYLTVTKVFEVLG